MDNISIKKIWEDGDLLELYVIAKSEFVRINQTCYTSIDDVIINSNKIKQYAKNGDVEAYVEFGNKDGNYTPAFSLNFFPCDDYGHLIIEADLEITDNKTRIHRCKFFINAELGAVEYFGTKLSGIKKRPYDDWICLYNE